MEEHHGVILNIRCQADAAIRLVPLDHMHGVVWAVRRWALKMANGALARGAQERPGIGNEARLQWRSVPAAAPAAGSAFLPARGACWVQSRPR